MEQRERRETEGKMRRMMIKRRCEWGRRRGERGRGRRSPTPGQNTQPSSVQREKWYNMSKFICWIRNIIPHILLCRTSSNITLKSNHSFVNMFDKKNGNNNNNSVFTMRHVPVWVEAILQERGTTFPEINDWSFWSCCRRDLTKHTEH